MNAPLQILQQIAKQVASALSESFIVGSSAFVETPLTYPDGSHVVVRIDGHGDSFLVSDDGYAARAAEIMGGLRTFQRFAPDIARRSGISFDLRSFFVMIASRDQIVGATIAVANASLRAIERTIFSLEERRIGKAREMFESKVRSAFGPRAAFDIPLKGASGHEWEMEAGVFEDRRIVSAFTLVTKHQNSVASAHMKLSDLQMLDRAPHLIAALTEYDRTDPTLRSLLSTVSSSVIAANDDIEVYLRVA